MTHDIEKLYKKGKKESSPVSLDTIILNQAKNSCDTSPVVKSQKRKWLYSLSTAAVVVMSFSIIFNLQYENSQIMTPTYIEEIGTSTPNEPVIKPSAGLLQNDNQPKVSPPKRYTKETNLQDTLERRESPLPIVNTKQNDEFEKKRPIVEKLNKLDKQEFLKQPVSKVGLSSELKPEKLSESIAELAVPEEISNDESKLSLREEDSVSPLSVTSSSIKRNKEGNKKIYSQIVQMPDFSQQMIHLEKLIDEEKFNQAKKYLQQLIDSYPNYDFSKYIKQLD